MGDKPYSPTAIRQAVKWYRKAMMLDSWQINVEVAKLSPDWVPADAHTAASTSNAAFRRAWIWLHPGGHDSGDWLISLFHELLHISLIDAGFDGKCNDYTEHLLNRLCRVFAGAYRAGVEAQRRKPLVTIRHA